MQTTEVSFTKKKERKIHAKERNCSGSFRNITSLREKDAGGRDDPASLFWTPQPARPSFFSSRRPRGNRGANGVVPRRRQSSPRRSGRRRRRRNPPETSSPAPRWCSSSRRWRLSLPSGRRRGSSGSSSTASAPERPATAAPTTAPPLSPSFFPRWLGQSRASPSVTLSWTPASRKKE